MPGIIFDLDDTLYCREHYVRSGFEAVATHVADSWRRHRDAVLETLHRAHTGGFERGELQVLCAEHRLPLSAVPALVRIVRSHRPALALSEEVRGVLARLRRESFRLAILTNGDPEVQRRKIEALGLTACVDCVVYAEEHAAAGKPHPGVFLHAADRLELLPAHCVHVGDDPACDIAGARSAGLRAIRVLHPPDPCVAVRRSACPQRPVDAAPDATIDTVLDVLPAARMLLQEAARVV